MSALTDFLQARIADDEEWARLWGCDDAHVGTDLHPGCRARVLAECDAKRRIVEHETRQTRELAEWTPDCGGDWCLSGGALSHEPGVGYFANYWPDNTVSASVYVDGEDVARSGIVPGSSRAACQAFAEQFVRDNLPNASTVLRLLALPYVDHPDYREEWKPRCQR